MTMPRPLPEAAGGRLRAAPVHGRRPGVAPGAGAVVREAVEARAEAAVAPPGVVVPGADPAAPRVAAAGSLAACARPSRVK